MTIVMIGGGGHCRACLDVITGAGLAIAGIVDPRPVPPDMAPWLGDDSWLDSKEARDGRHLVTVGQMAVSPLRRELFEALLKRGLSCATILSSSAIVSPNATIGAGSIVMHGTIINRGAKVGCNGIINTGAIVEHDAQIEDHCHVSTGAVINGGAHVGEGCMIGSGAIILQGIKIAANVLVGAGAVVTRDIETAGTWMGVPARTAP